MDEIDATSSYNEKYMKGITKNILSFLTVEISSFVLRQDLSDWIDNSETLIYAIFTEQ